VTSYPSAFEFLPSCGDRDVSKAASLFPRKRTKTIADIGLLQNASDAQIVKEACDRQLTIVTGNGDDFVKEINKFLAQTKKASDGCHEVFGLVVLPNGYERQRLNTVPVLVLAARMSIRP
jgi:hypothetical protein